MRGHAGANVMSLVCSNRVGREVGTLVEVTYFGQCFIAGPQGQVLERADKTSETFVTHTFDLEEIAGMRAHWGLFRDRRSGPLWPASDDRWFDSPATVGGSQPPRRSAASSARIASEC